MKSINLLITVLLLSSYSLIGQKLLQQRTPYIQGKEIFLNLPFASNITIISSEIKEIVTEASISINNNKNNDNFLLLHIIDKNNNIQVKPVINGTSNIASLLEDTYLQGFNLYWDEENKIYINTIYSSSDFNKKPKPGESRLKVGPHTAKIIEIESHYKISIPKNAKVRLKSTSANVKIENHENGSLDIETSHGNIEFITTPSGKYSFTLYTSTGKLFANLSNVNIKDGSTSFLINGGGSQIFLKTLSGNIYLNKK